jgi:phosphoribosyl 1,2-cyclic phosphodiesterase
MEPRIHLHVLASGSRGNAAVVEGPGGSIIIDCGLSRSELLRRADQLGVDVEGARAVLVTHEHSDHTSGLRVLANRCDADLIATAGTASGRSDLLALPFTLVSHDETLELAGMVVTAFPTSHDVADPMGLRFAVVDGDGEVIDAVGWCTDTGYLTAEALGALRGVRILGIESNHDSDMLARGPYPAFLKRRVAGERGHLSNDQACDLVRRFASPRLRKLALAHLSRDCNVPHVAEDAMRTTLCEIGRTDIDLKVLYQDEIVEI